jgi:3-oxoacyl-[acyl-carrier protein] reductase
MDLGIAGRCAAVAGASGGLGLGCAQALAADGVRVVLCGRDAARAEAAAHDIRDAGGDAVGLAADVSTVDGAAGFVARAIDALGRLDIVVANAGGPPAGTFASTDVDAYLPALELNLLSTVAMCKAAVPAMVERGWGRIVAITSLTVRQPAASLILSNTARAGATGFLKTLAREVAPHGVTVNSVQPGSHDTDRLRELHGGDLAGAAAGIPAGTVGDPADFGAAVAFLCSERARFVSGVALPIDGGAFAGLQ